MEANAKISIPTSVKFKSESQPDKERQVAVWQIDSTETRQDSHDTHAYHANPTDQLRHSKKPCKVKPNVIKHTRTWGSIFTKLWQTTNTWTINQ